MRRKKEAGGIVGREQAGWGWTWDSRIGMRKGNKSKGEKVNVDDE